MIELLYGIYFIKGGMYTMATALARLFTELGGQIVYNTPVSELVIQNRQAVGVKIDTLWCRQMRSSVMQTFPMPCSR